MAEVNRFSDKGGSPFDNLPVEIVGKILAYIPIQERVQIQSVCKLWGHVIWNGVSNLSFDVKIPTAFATTIGSILPRCNKILLQLHLTHHHPTDLRYGISRMVTESLAASCPNLKEINLSGLRLPDVCLEILSKGCSDLKVARLHNCSGFSEDGLADFLEKCMDIEVLHVTLPRSFMGRWLSSISSKVKVLSVEHLISDGRPIALQFIPAKCECLQELRLLCDINIKGLKECFERLSKTLTALHIGNLNRFIANSFCNSLKALTNLEVFSCVHMSCELLRCLGEHCRKLSNLKIRGDMEMLSAVPANELPSLKVLDVSGCSMRLSGIGFVHLGVPGKLEEVYANRTALGDNVFIHIVRYSPNLRVLEIAENKRVSDKLVAGLHTSERHNVVCSCNSKPLKVLVRDTSVSKLTKTCHQLDLDFYSEGRSAELPEVFIMPTSALRLSI